MKSVTLITDGSCLGNPGPGGWAALLRYGEVEKEFCGAEKATTNNRMELTAVIEGLKALKEPCEILIRTDSQYVCNAFKQGWLINWKKNGWKTAAKKPVKNDDLWRLLDTAIAPHKVTWEWVKAHNGDPDNERVDDLARSQAETL